MASKKVTPREPERSHLIIETASFVKKLNERIEKGKSLSKSFTIRTGSDLEAAREQYYKWNDFNSELLKSAFDYPNNEYKDRYDRCTNKIMYFSQTFHQEVDEFFEDFQKKIVNLESLVDRADLIPVVPMVQAGSIVHPTTSNLHSQNVFIVHGHDSAMKNEVARVLGNLKLNPIILHEQPNKGRTLIEKFEANSNVGFAVVLLTPDDEGRKKDTADLQARARQNVIFEFGYFIGRLGRHKVVALYMPNVELPSDLDGLVYVEYDAKGAWKLELWHELIAAGYSVDAKHLR